MPGSQRLCPGVVSFLDGMQGNYHGVSVGVVMADVLMLRFLSLVSKRVRVPAGDAMTAGSTETCLRGLLPVLHVW